MLTPPILLQHRLRIAREFAGLAQDRLAFRVGVSALTIRHWETGATKPSRYAIGKFARECNVDVEWILIGEEAVERITCPVCLRPAAILGAERIVALHNDKARRRCPMVGAPAPVAPEPEAASA